MKTLKKTFIKRVYDCREKNIDVIDLTPEDHMPRISNTEARLAAQRDICETESMCYLGKDRLVQQLHNL